MSEEVKSKVYPEDLPEKAKDKIRELAKRVRESGKVIYYPNGEPTCACEDEIVGHDRN